MYNSYCIFYCVVVHQIGVYVTVKYFVFSLAHLLSVFLK